MISIRDPTKDQSAALLNGNLYQSLCMDGSINLQCGRKNDNPLLQVAAKLDESGFIMNWEVG